MTFKSRLSYGFEMHHLRHMILITVLLILLSSSTLQAQDDPPFLTPADYFAENDIERIPLTEYGGVDQFTEDNLINFDDGSSGITLEISDVDGDASSIQLTVKAFDTSQVIDYLNETQVYFDVLALQEGQTLAVNQLTDFDDIFLDAVQTEIGDENFAELETTLQNTLEETCSADEAISLNELIGEESASAALMKALSNIQTQMSIDIPDPETDETRETIYPLVEEEYNRLVTENVCPLLEDSITADAQPEGVTILIDLTEFTENPDSDARFLVYYSIDPPLNAGQVDEYKARKVVTATAKAKADVNTIRLDMWRFKRRTGAVKWSDSETHTAGNPDPRELSNTHICKKTGLPCYKWHDVAVTALEDNSEYTIEGGWELGPNP